MIVLFSTLLFSKSGCLLELCYIYLHLLTASKEGVQYWSYLLQDDCGWRSYPIYTIHN